MEVLGIPELTSEQIEELCTTAEEAARKKVLSKITMKNVDTLDITAEAEGSKPVRLEVEVEVDLVSPLKDSEVQKVVDEALKEAFSAAGEYLRKIACRIRK